MSIKDNTLIVPYKNRIVKALGDLGRNKMDSNPPTAADWANAAASDANRKADTIARDLRDMMSMIRDLSRRVRELELKDVRLR